MAKYVRLLITIGMLLFLVMLARNRPAWAANPTTGTNRASLVRADDSVSHSGDNECKKGRDKNKHKCKDDDDDEKKCKKKKGCGTVKPPKHKIEVCMDGNYSVGGIATLNVQNLLEYRCLKAYTRSPDPVLDQIPDGSKILSDVIGLEFPPSGAKVEICFAAPPNKQVNIYSSARGSFQLLKTRVINGIACADGTEPGGYTLAGR